MSQSDMEDLGKAERKEEKLFGTPKTKDDKHGGPVAETNSEDCCPKCGGSNMEFGSIGYYDSGQSWEAKCKDCGFEGQQHYNIVFACFTDKDGKEL